MTRTPRIFYGWFVLAAGCSVTALVGGINVYGISLFLVPLTTEFGWTRSAISGAISLARLEGGLLGPIEGLLVDRLGPRRIMLVGLPMMGVGFILLGQLSAAADLTGLDSLAIFYIVYIVFISMGGALGTFTPATTAVANWFLRRRSFALGILSSGLGVGAGIGSPLLGQAIQNLGWREAAMLAGAIVFVVGMPAALVMRHRPEQYGYLPDGDAAPVSQALSRGHGQGERDGGPAEENFTVREALATRAFWILTFSFTLRIMVSGAVALHLAPLLQDMGMTTAEAAGVLSALAIISILGRFGIGWLGDLVDKRLIYLIGLGTMTLGLLALAFAEELWQVALFVALYAPSYGGLASLMFAIRGEYFGRRAFATIGGAMGPVTTVGTITGPLLAGYAFDTTGSYRLAMLAFAASTVVAILLVFFLKRPRLSPAAQDLALAR